MELRQLEYFIAIVDSGAFSRAAMKLSMGQPVLSRQIKALETELGVELYHRTGRGIVLTEAGKLLEHYARGILETAGNAQREIASLGTSPTGSVVIGMPPSVGAALAVTVIKRFYDEYPKVSLGAMEGFSAHVLDWLLAGRIDVAVLYDAPRIHSLMTDPLLTDELFLLGPASDPAGLGSGELPSSILKDIPLILPSRPHGLRILVENFLAKAGLKPNVRFEIDAMPSTLRLVEGGVAYTVLSYSCVHDLVAAGRIKCWRLVEPKMTRSLVVASSTQRPSTKASRALSNIVREEAHRMVTQGRWNPHF
jgi:LysR family nitrogen assimilation transcriptional regulator